MARDFDGVDDKVDFGDINDLEGTATLSASIWFAYDGLASFRSLIGKLSTDTLDGWSIQQSDGSLGGQDDLLLTIRNAAVKHAHTTGLGLAADGAWHNAILVYDGAGASDAARLKAWVDGVSQSLTYSATPIPATIGSHGQSFTIGTAGNGEAGINGKEEEGAVWTRVLTTAEIAAIAGRASALLIPTNLRFYSPIYGNGTEPNEVGTESGTVTGTTQSTHHNMYFFQKQRFSMSDGALNAIASGLGGALVE